MKSDLLTTGYASLKSIRQDSLSANMTSKMQDSIEVTLAAAFHDHISCAKSPDSCQPVHKQEKAHMPCETDHIYANSSGAGTLNKFSAADESQQRLKDMVLFQLDLIQHQQEQLAMRDRQLQVLRQEKEALKVRLERMERRMSLLKQRKDLLGRSVQAEGNQVTCPPLASSPSKTESRQHIKAAYKSIHGSSQQGNLDSAEPVLEHSWNTPLFLSETESVPARDDKKTSAGVSSCKAKAGGLQRASAGGQRPQKGRSQMNRAQDGMRTPHLYALPLSFIGPEPELARVESSNIEVPRWIHHPVTSCYQMEGTENLDDEIFLRRHHKLEIDEKRRKRWDLQRLREQKHTDKLRRGRERNVSYCRGIDQRSLNSFFPYPADVQFVEVSETVPVVAFGCTIPHIPSSEFSLDWLPGSRLCQKEQSAAGGSRKGGCSNIASTTITTPKKEN